MHFVPGNSHVLSFLCGISSYLCFRISFLHSDTISSCLLSSLFAGWLLKWMLHLIPLDVCLFCSAFCYDLRKRGLPVNWNCRAIEPVDSAVGTFYPNLPCVWSSCFFTICKCGRPGITESGPESRLTALFPGLLNLCPKEITCRQCGTRFLPVAVQPLSYQLAKQSPLVLR